MVFQSRASYIHAYLRETGSSSIMMWSTSNTHRFIRAERKHNKIYLKYYAYFSMLKFFPHLIYDFTFFLSLFFTLLVISILASHTYAIKCYVCGEGADRPFVESTNINQSLVERIQSSCDGFHSNLTPQEREKYAFECPTEYKGCSIVVGGKQ